MTGTNIIEAIVGVGTLLEILDNERLKKFGSLVKRKLFYKKVRKHSPYPDNKDDLQV